MILFFSKDDGKILGTVEGRIHSPNHLKMWIGDVETTERLIIEYIKVREDEEIYYEPILEEYIDKDGFTMTREIGRKKKKRVNDIFEPNHEQKELLLSIEKNPSEIYKYKVDIHSKLLVPLT